MYWDTAEGPPELEKADPGVHQRHDSDVFSRPRGEPQCRRRKMYRVSTKSKAAFLYHFSQFVDWPEGTFKETNSPLVYCTIGEDPFHGALDASLSGKTIGARTLQVQHFKQPQEIRGCQILFIRREQSRNACRVY